MRRVADATRRQPPRDAITVVVGDIVHPQAPGMKLRGIGAATDGEQGHHHGRSGQAELASQPRTPSRGFHECPLVFVEYFGAGWLTMSGRIIVE